MTIETAYLRSAQLPYWVVGKNFLENGSVNIRGIIDSLEKKVLLLDLSETELRLEDLREITTKIIDSSAVSILLECSTNNEQEEEINNIYITLDDKNDSLSYFINRLAARRFYPTKQNIVINKICEIIQNKPCDLSNLNLESFLQIEGLLDSYNTQVTETIQHFNATHEIFWANKEPLPKAEDILDYLQFKPLIHLAAIFGRKSVVEDLLNRGVPIDLPDINGYPPIYLAMKHNQNGIVDVLLQKEVEVRRAANDVPEKQELLERDDRLRRKVILDPRLIIHCLKKLSEIIPAKPTSGASSSDSNPPQSSDLGRYLDRFLTAWEKLETFRKNLISTSTSSDSGLSTNPLGSSYGPSKAKKPSKSSSKRKATSSRPKKRVKPKESISSNYETFVQDYHNVIKNYEKMQSELDTYVTGQLLLPQGTKISDHEIDIIINVNLCLKCLKRGISDYLVDIKNLQEPKLAAERKRIIGLLIAELEKPRPAQSSESPEEIKTNKDIAFVKMLKKTFSVIDPCPKEDFLELLKSVVEKDYLESLKVIAKFGADLNSVLEDRTTLTDLAFQHESIRIAKYLLSHQLNQKGLSFLIHLPRVANPHSEVEKLRSSLQTIQDNFIHAQSDIQQQFTSQKEAVRQLEDLLDVDLHRKRELLFLSENGRYYEEFDRIFRSSMTTELDGMKVALSNWVVSNDPSSVKGAQLLEGAAKASPIPGTSLAAKVILHLPKSYLKGKQKDLLDQVSSSFPDGGVSNHFTQALSYHLIEIMKEQLIILDELLDEADPTKGSIVSSSQIENLVKPLIARILLFLFLDFPALDPQEAKRSSRNRGALYEAARTTALSVIGFYPTQAKKRFRLALTQGEYLGQLSLFNTTVARREFEGNLTLFQHSQRLGNALINWDKDELKDNRITLTAEGFLRSAPIECEGEKYEPHNRESRSEKYPPLILSEENKNILNSKFGKAGTNFLKAVPDDRKNLPRKTLSVKERLERGTPTNSPASSSSSQDTILPPTPTPIEVPTPIPTPQTMTTVSSSNIGIFETLQADIQSMAAEMRTMNLQMENMREQIATAKIAEELLKQKEIDAVKRKIFLVPYYSVNPEWELKKESITQRISNLYQLGVRSSEIRKYHKKFQATCRKSDKKQKRHAEKNSKRLLGLRDRCRREEALTEFGIAPQVAHKLAEVIDLEVNAKMAFEAEKIRKAEEANNLAEAARSTDVVPL